MSRFEELARFLPETQSFIGDISDAILERSPGQKITVREYVQEQMQRIDETRSMSNSDKFKEFIGRFLYVQVKSETADKAIQFISDNFSNANELATADTSSLAAELRKLGYRFPNKAQVLIDISKILRDTFNGNIDNYVAFADTHYDDDPILDVKGVAFKTRDIALSSFTKKYSLVDVHIMDVLSRTGLILNAYFYGFELTTNRSIAKNYREIIRLLDKLSKEAGMMPFEFDQTLWVFGKYYCSPKKCEKCLARKCVTRDFSRARNE